jgi:uncharacterized membrane protein
MSLGLRVVVASDARDRLRARGARRAHEWRTSHDEAFGSPALAVRDKASLADMQLSLDRILLALLMAIVGVLHFTHAATFASIVPDYLPAPLALVWISGACELGLGLALLFEKTRVLAAWGLVALYVAVFPANIHMALHPDLPLAGVPEAWHPSAASLWLRLPLQLGFIAWALQYRRPGLAADGGRLAQTR